MSKPSTSFAVVRLPRIAADTDDADHLALAQAYRDLRLLALRTNPEAFGSSYEVEVERGIEQTLQRLSNSKAATFVVVRNESDVEALSAAFWLGTLTLLGPLDAKATVEESQPKRTGALSFALNGVFVRPEFRGTGLAKRLMNAALDEAQLQCRLHSHDQFICSVSVDSENYAAKALYGSAGFVQIGREKYVQQPREVEPGVLRSAERLANCLELQLHLNY